MRRVVAQALILGIALSSCSTSDGASSAAWVKLRVDGAQHSAFRTGVTSKRRSSPLTSSLKIFPVASSPREKPWWWMSKTALLTAGCDCGCRVIHHPQSVYRFCCIEQTSERGKRRQQRSQAESTAPT